MDLLIGNQWRNYLDGFRTTFGNDTWTFVDLAYFCAEKSSNVSALKFIEGKNYWKLFSYCSLTKKIFAYELFLKKCFI